jgi:hypothetical protein
MRASLEISGQNAQNIAQEDGIAGTLWTLGSTARQPIFKEIPQLSKSFDGTSWLCSPGKKEEMI